MPMEHPEAELAAHDPGMVLPVRNKEGNFQGIQVVWLNADMTAKRKDEPQRQSFGLIKGNFLQLTEIDWDHSPSKLIIAEGHGDGAGDDAVHRSARDRHRRQGLPQAGRAAAVLGIHRRGRQ